MIILNQYTFDIIKNIVGIEAFAYKDILGTYANKYKVNNIKDDGFFTVTVSAMKTAVMATLIDEKKYLCISGSYVKPYFSYPSCIEGYTIFNDIKYINIPKNNRECLISFPFDHKFIILALECIIFLRSRNY